MRSRRKKRLIFIILVPALIVVGATLWSLFTLYQSRRAAQSLSSDSISSAEGWKISRMHGNNKLYDASIESFSVERAKMGPFTIGPLHIARLKNVVLDFHAEGLLSLAAARKRSTESGISMADALQDSFADIRSEPVFRSRKIRILDIERVALSLWEGEKRAFRISSDQATADRRTGDIIFIGHASLDAGENGSVIAYRIRLVKKTSLFRIDDAFILTRSGKKTEGRGLETDYRLKKITYKAKTDQ